MVDEAQVVALARKYALQNAVQHGGKANPGAVVGRIMGESPELRSAAGAIMPLVQSTVAEVNAMDADAQKEALASLDPGLLEKRRKERGHPFKTLPRFDEHASIVMRFAPNPNGPATLGHSRGMVTMSEYKRLANEAGKDAVLIVRFDDTDPQVKPPWPPAYEWMLEDYAWLGERPERVVRASARLESYYEVATALIDRGAAYVCFCTQQEAKRMRDAGTPCPHRDEDPHEHRARWGHMLAGTYSEGEATLRIKTEVAHRDPALRDWVAFRVVKTPHPHPDVGDKYVVWPMLDFESAVEDHLQGVTHIIRGKDLMDSTHRQRFLYTHMGWTYPETLYWGRVRLDEIGKFSSSGMRRDIEAGRYSGWDDPRLPTLRALRRRGIQPAAVRAFWVNMGLSEKDVAASMVNLYAENAKRVEAQADRFFFVAEPVRAALAVAEPDVTELAAESLRHPEHAERGLRLNRLLVSNGVAAVYLEASDLDGVTPGTLLRLKDLGNVRVEEAGASPRLTWVGDDLAEARRVRAAVVHWVPAHDDAVVPLEMLRPEPSEAPEGVRHQGVAERAVLDAAVEQVVQFERYGYARLERIGPDGVRAVFAHE